MPTNTHASLKEKFEALSLSNPEPLSSDDGIRSEVRTFFAEDTPGNIRSIPKIFKLGPHYIAEPLQRAKLILRAHYKKGYELDTVISDYELGDGFGLDVIRELLTLVKEYGKVTPKIYFWTTVVDVLVSKLCENQNEDLLDSLGIEIKHEESGAIDQNHIRSQLSFLDKPSNKTQIHKEFGEPKIPNERSYINIPNCNQKKTITKSASSPGIFDSKNKSDQTAKKEEGSHAIVLERSKSSTPV